MRIYAMAPAVFRARLLAAPAFLATVLIASDSRGQTVFTSAGGGIYEYTPGQPGAGGFATVPGNALTLAFDQAGDLFVPNTGNGTIIEITPNRMQTVFASGLTTPAALAFDGSGNLYASDITTSTIYRYAPDGTRTTFATGLYTPYGLTVSSSGNVFAVANSVIYEFNPNGVRSTFATVTGQGVGGIAFNSAGDLFATAGGTAGYIYEFAPDGTRTTFATGLNEPLNLAFNSAGDLFVTEFGTSPYLVEFAPDGQQIGTTYNIGTGAIGLAIEPVPEPSAACLLALGGFIILLARTGFYRAGRY